jgi:hypothetical protein
MVGATTSKGTHFPVDPNSWLQEHGVSAAAAAARQSGDWSSFTVDRFRQLRGFNSVTRQIAGAPGRWYQSLVQYGAVLPAEEMLIRAVLQSKGSADAAVAKGAIPEEKLKAWGENTLKPIVERCRATGNWSPLAARPFEDHEYFKPFHSRIGKAQYRYDGLVGALLVTQEESDLARKQARKDSGAAIKEKAKERYTLEELRQWIDTTLPRIVDEAYKPTSCLHFRGARCTKLIR